MARSMVLLDREIAFSPDDAVSARQFPWGFWEGRMRTREGLNEDVNKYLRTFKARAVVANPPELSFLHILVPPRPDQLPPPCMDLDWGRISSTDKYLVALYAGGYRPGSTLLGGYLIYDARNNSLSAVPRLPSDDFHRAMGHQSAVVMCDAHGEGYLLAELVIPQFSRAGVWLWKSSTKEWVMLSGSHPLPSRSFSVDLCFSYRGSTFCWVDLLKELVRSIACVCGRIKLIALDIYGLELIVWTLLTDHSGWMETSRYTVDKIWANVNYQSTVLRQLLPSLPVLSIHQDGVVYLVVNDENMVDHRLEHKGQYLLRVDMKNDEVQISPQPTRRINSQLFATEFSEHSQHLQDNPRERFEMLKI